MLFLVLGLLAQWQIGTKIRNMHRRLVMIDFAQIHELKLRVTPAQCE